MLVCVIKSELTTVPEPAIVKDEVVDPVNAPFDAAAGNATLPFNSNDVVPIDKIPLV